MELIPGGSDVRVSNANKLQYVTLQSQRILCGGSDQALARICQGVRDVVTGEQLKMFTPHDLQVLIGGPFDIVVKDLMKAVVYEGYASYAIARDCPSQVVCRC